MPRKATTKRKTNGSIAESSEEARRSAYDMILASLASEPEIAEAGLTRLDLELALEDRGFIKLGSIGAGEIDQVSRETMVERARLYWHRDPLCKQAVRLWTDYSVGDGLTFRAEKPAVQTILEDFWKDRRNRRILRARGQRKSSTKLLVDGEIFFALFGDLPIVRRIDPLQITKIISLPDDAETPVFYKREFRTPAGRARTIYYLDSSFGGDDAPEVPIIKDESGNVIKHLPKVLMYHVPFDDFFQRGNSLLGTVLDWCREHRRFMTARVAITQALSKFALKLSVQGGSGSIALAKKQLGSTADRDTGETNPPPVAGSTWLENKAATLTAMPRATGASESRDDSDLLKLMISAGTNIMLHYFGDPSTGNLATSTSMELPMRKAFQAYRQIWIEVYEDLFEIVLARHDLAGAVVDIDLPPILDADIAALGQSLTAVKAAQPEIPDQPEMIQHTLNAYRLNNVAEIVKRIEKEREEKAEAEPEPLTPDQAELMATRLPEALRTLREVLFNEGEFEEVVRRVGSQWFVFSQAGKKLSKGFGTEAEAQKRLHEIEFFKRTNR